MGLLALQGNMFIMEDKVHPKPIRLIAAACKNMGIGINGHLPWHLPKEFKFFLDTISSVSRPGKKNVLVWGRRCWVSSTEHLHLITNAIHVVLSRTLPTVPEHAHHLCRSFENALHVASSTPLRDFVETIWIIGGVEPYREALSHPWCDLVYLTDIMAEFECNTFFPEFDKNIYKLQDHFPGLPDEIQEDRGIKYRYQVFKKESQDRCDLV